MKHKLLLILLLLLTQVLFAQTGKRRILISPHGDVIPLEKGESATLAAAVRAKPAIPQSGCNGEAYFGYLPSQYPITTGTYGLHKDVIGSWFTVPASGVIDTIFWVSQTDVCAKDSLLYVRINQSNVFENHGPGYDGYPVASTHTCWGYYPNSNDENGIAAFPDDLPPDATDTAWVSTVTSGPGPSYPPFGYEIWGLGGQAVKTRLNTVNYINTSIIPPALENPLVQVGDHIMITFRINGSNPEPCKIGGPYTGFAAYGGSPDTLNDTLTHNWKYYEYVPDLPGYTCKGWVARGDFDLSIWYSMTVTTNIPPTINSFTDLKNTLSPAARTVTADIEDCNPANPESAGVAHAYLEYRVNNGTLNSIEMENIGGSIFEAEIPGYPPGTSVTYNLRANDAEGMETFNAPTTYSVVRTKATLAMLDTSSSCVRTSIRNTGTAIDTSTFFIPQQSTATNPKDDGTAGPFDLGKPFFLGNTWYRYAWVGVNGAMTLSKTATDTTDANSNGFYTTNFTFPYPIRHGRSDTTHSSYMPRTFIAPFWNDMIIGDSTHQYGHIYYKNDSTHFTVEWDSLGTFTTSHVYSDEMVFRVVLNKSDNTVEFQYDNVGLTGLDTTALVGIQGDSSDATGSSYIFVNQNSAPIDLIPRDQYCMKFYNGISVQMQSKWNLISEPVIPALGDSTRTTIFPTANSQAYAYNGGYISRSKLDNGPGYWLKFSGSEIITFYGTPITHRDIPIIAGWNLVGSIALPVSTSNISTTPFGIIGSLFYSYTNGYTPTSTINPGKGYWVKSSASGTLTLDATPSLEKSGDETDELSVLQSLTITDASGSHQTLYLGSDQILQKKIGKFDMPPTPPTGIFDARFASGRIAESYPTDFSTDKEVVRSIAIQSAEYPVTVQWRSFVTDGVTLTLTDNEQGKKIGSTVLSGSGKVVIKDANVRTLLLKATEGATKPRAFALSQNYPNPFNPSTRFSVEVPQLSDVDISVFDVLGRKIATIFNGTKQAGSYTVEWNGQDNAGYTLPTGVYLVRMNAGDFSSTRKVLLMK